MNDEVQHARYNVSYSKEDLAEVVKDLVEVQSGRRVETLLIVASANLTLVGAIVTAVLLKQHILNKK